MFIERDNKNPGDSAQEPGYNQNALGFQVVPLGTSRHPDLTGEQPGGGLAGIVSSNSVASKECHVTGEGGANVPDQEYQRLLMDRLLQQPGELREKERE